eukprot:COSAG04_NODE_120_length_24916_cov_9.576218_4_plen_84_part_00
MKWLTRAHRQGAICHNEGQSQVALPHCRGCGVGCAMTECVRNTAGEFSGQCNYEQPAVFGCIDYCSCPRCVRSSPPPLTRTPR